MIPQKRLDLPPERQFDVAKATRSLKTLAQTEPEAVIVLTLAQLSADGLEAESDVYLTATAAAALLATVAADQRLTAGGRELVALCVARARDEKRRAPSYDDAQESPPDEF